MVSVQEGSRLRRGLWSLLTVLAAVVGLVAVSGPANAVTWYDFEETWVGSSDPDGRWAHAWLTTNSNGDGASYEIMFNPYGEMLYLVDSMSDGHAARGELLVYDRSGDLVDRDTFYRDTGDDPLDTLDLGTPDGSGNIPDGYNVWMRVCINETSTCTSYVRGTA